ncbi:hypothetical protein [Leifsonia sp. SIMBA_070]|uniref:hypothetical protein n=1 Tax=Leifsonia sp. SIMBA_070 TaxID=3085810 RepID=UPI00397D6E0E
MTGTHRTPITCCLAVLAGALVAAAALTGCTTAVSVHTPAATAKVSTASWPTGRLYHTGRTDLELVMPSGAHSLHVDFSCTSGLYEVAPAIGSMDSRSGSCGGAQAFDFDLGTTAAGSHVRVDFVVPDDTRFAADLRFSPNTFRPDPATKKECAALSTLVQTFWNADQAHDHGDLTDAGWAQKTASAKGALTALSESTQHDGTTGGLLGTVIPPLASWLTGDGYHPGGMLHAPLGDFTAADSLAGQICSANGTPMVISSSYGG